MSGTRKVQLHCPPLDEVADVLREGLQYHFAEVSVSVEDCPDLRPKPFMLAGQGLCGKPRIADVGGVPYLLPLPQKDKKYDIGEIAKEMECPEGLLIGPGCGPFHVVGVNAELIANIKCGSNEANHSYFAKVAQDGSCHLQKLGVRDFCIMGNFFASEAKPGKVLKVHAKKRTGPEGSFTSAMRKILKEHYGEKPVSLGGVFLIAQGKAKLHVMPDFSSVPLTCNEDVEKWLNFYDTPAPLVCLSVFHSHDPGLDLRIEHTHCFSDHGEGGHYHYDTTPDRVEYLGYFNVAEYLYRIDAPLETHQYGRD